ncbi:MAG: hypothetical protein PHD99_04840 [Candidatus Moranbacteria bacterium]|nr:hypothetical protein [Candidatus Moranbacteria bacterium]
MTITAQSVIHRATDLLQDQTSIRWPVKELVRWLNDAQRAIVKVRPDSMNTTATMTLSAGTRQDLDSATADAAGNSALSPLPAKLIEITRNMAATSSKGAVTLVPRKILDAQTPNWHNATGVVNVMHYMFDPKDPKTFYVYPPATALAQLEVMYAAYPIDITEPLSDTSIWSDVTGNLTLPDIYADDVLNLVMYRCYSKDSEYAGNDAKAVAYLNMVTASLGAEIAATVAVSPK